MHKDLIKFFLPKILTGLVFGVALLGITVGTLKIKEDKFLAQKTIPQNTSAPQPTLAPKPTEIALKQEPSFKEQVLSAQSQNLPKSIRKKEIIGFLPFWLVKEAQINYSNITTLIYFGISFDKNGQVIRLQGDNTEEPGWTRYNSDELETILTTARSKNVHTELAIRIMENETITTVVNNPLARKNLINNIIEELKRKKIEGVNVDFEYQGIPDAHTINNFNAFMDELNTAIHQFNPRYTVSVDVYPDAIQKTRLWDLNKLPKDTDRVIVMAYDYTRQDSKRAGPVAPIGGSPDKYEHDVTSTVKDYISVLPKYKIILGIPFYGYDWPTFDDTPQSETRRDSEKYGSPALSSYKRTMELIKEKNITIKWDEEAQVPWFSYLDKEKQTNREVYFDNEKSISKKLSLLIDNDLAGIAIWALGYDGSDPILLNTIYQTLNP